MAVEIEIRSFISKEKYHELISFFKSNSKLINEDHQETFYFDSNEDLRIQKNNFFSKVWMKKGKIHDEQREEIEIKFPKEDFEKLENIFTSIGLKVKIKWFRNRMEFLWKDITVCLDYTKGYGYIIELEKMSDDNKIDTLNNLKEKLSSLNIPQTPREEFEKKFREYELNWRELTKS